MRTNHIIKQLNATSFHLEDALTWKAGGRTINRHGLFRVWPLGSSNSGMQLSDDVKTRQCNKKY